MNHAPPTDRKSNLSRTESHTFWLALVALAGLSVSSASAQTFGPNLLPAGNFESVQPTYIPWAGVDDKGNIHGIDGRQLAVNDDGSIPSHGVAFGPSVAAGDLLGHGKLDLVLADSKGFFWFFPNSGTPQKPAFTQGEVMPVWLGRQRVNGDAEGSDNVVPRIQLIDLGQNKRLDIVAGTYSGSLYLVPNVGSSSAPVFKPTVDRDSLLINTHKQGLLWCNYLAPFLTTAFGAQNGFDLVMGEGTYSANSIYLLRDTNSGGRPAFDEDHLQKIIPGMGLEQLTPVVVDWNNDGKPDIICGDRTGFINLFLNNSSDPSQPTFAPGVHLKIAGVEQFGTATTVSIADLTGNHLPNLLIGQGDGIVLYAINTGKLGEPAFNLPATPIKGVLPPTYHYLTLRNWDKYQAFGVPYELVGAVNPQLEPGFTFPEGENSRYALKFSVWPFKSTYFPERFYPPNEDQWNEHVVGCNQSFILKLNTRYRIHFWVKMPNNVSDFRYKLVPQGYASPKGFKGYPIMNPVDAGTDWSEFTSNIEVDNQDDPTVKTWAYKFEFRFTGQGTFYIDDLQIQEELN